MSHPRKNSVRDKVIGKRWIYADSERSILHRRIVGHHRGQVRLWNVAWLVFIGWASSYVNEWEDYSNYFGEGAEISRIRPPPTPWSFNRPWNLHGTSACVISLADWGSRSSLVCSLGPIWFQSVQVVSLGYVLLSKVVPCPFPSCYSTFENRTGEPSKREVQSVQCLPQHSHTVTFSHSLLLTIPFGSLVLILEMYLCVCLLDY